MKSPVNCFLGSRRPEQPAHREFARSRFSKRIVASGLTAVALTCCLSPSAHAAVSVTGAAGGSAISADTAATGGSGAWTTLGPIIIDENKKMDISSGSGVTLVLKAPAGFQFNTASTPSISFAGGADITSASVAVNDPSTLTITMNVSGTGAIDTLTVGSTGLQIRPTVGGPLATSRHIYRPASGGGSANITGITTSTDGSSGSNFGNLGEVPGTFVKLQLLMPGETASPGSPSGKTGSAVSQNAGTAFSAIVNGVDANWNIVPGASGTAFTIHLASTDPNATVAADADLSSGTRTFSVTFRTAGTASLTASDVDNGAITPSTSPTITVNSGPFSRLQILAPGETAVPGSASGKAGTPSPQIAGSPFSVTVNAVDANWNLIPTNDTVVISSSDANAVLPPNAALASGSGSFTVTLRAAGSRTVTAADVSHPGISANTSASILVSAAAFAKLQLLLPGESAAPGSASGKTGSPTPLTAGTPVSATVNGVDPFWNLVNTVGDTVSITCSDPAATLPADAPLVNGSGSFSLTARTSGNQTLTASDVSDIGKTAATDNASVNPGPATQLVLARQPSASASAGVAFAQQPVIFIEDIFNNVRSNDALIVTAAPGSGIGNLLGTTTITSMNGVASFANVACAGAGTNTILFTSGALTPVSSEAIVVAAGPFTRLLTLLPGETLAPGTATGRTGTPAATAGAVTSVRVNSTDTWFNPISNVTHTVSLSTSDTNAVLPASTPLVNGGATLNLTFKTAGLQTVTSSDVTDATKTNNTDSLTVAPGPFAQLQLLVPGELPAPGSVSGKVGAPSSEVAAAAFNVTVRGVDANWNVVSSASGANFTVQLTSSDPNAILPANADLVSGSQTFSVTLRTAGTATFTASDVDDGTKTPNTSPLITVNAGPFSQLMVLLPGEAAAPGTATGKTGAPSTQTAGVPFNVSVNSVDSAWNPRSTNDTVHITSSDANAVLPADSPLTNGVASLNVTFRTGGTRTVTAADISRSGIGTNTSSAATVNAGPYARLQVLMPGEAAAPGTASGKTGVPSGRVAGAAFNLSVGAVDAWWNQVATNATVQITSSDANAILPANSPLGATGLKTNFSLTFRTTGNQTVSAVDTSDATKNNTSSLTPVTAGPFAKLQLLVPGETAVPGTASGKSGTPSPQNSSVPFNVRVNSVDANWNPVSTNDTIRITSSDPVAILPPNAALAAGSQNFTITLFTPGTNVTVTASNVTHSGISPNTSPALTVLPALPLRGGPCVAIHDSEFTRSLENMTAGPATPSGAGTTGKEWWPTNWHYFVMPEALKEALRSEGIPFEVLADSDIISGRLLDTNGQPKYPILISLTSEALDNSEIPQISSYVAAGGFVFAGASAFTRNTNGTTRADFALANEMGLHMVTPGLTNWRTSGTFTKVIDDRLISHIPGGTLNWEMPVGSDETFWGVYPHPSNPLPNALAWAVQTSTARVLANGASSPFLTENAFGKGHFIYEAAMEPLVAHGGWGPGMYAHMIFRKAIEWAFESARLPLPRLSPWPWPYDAAFLMRHDLENYQNEIAGIEGSAQIEFTNGVKGDYFFCTGTLREEMSPTYNTNLVVGGLRSAITNYGATIGPHNGGLRNPFNNPALSTNSFDFWHWGPDEALDVIPSGWPSGKAYASASVSNAFLDIERWLPGLMTNGMRVWVAPYFDGTRENSFDIQAQLGVKISGDQKLTPLPHWTVSTATSGKRYGFLSIPVSDWFINGTVGQAMELNHTTNTVHALIDYYYSIGSLINLYSHTLSSGVGGAGFLPLDYITYCNNTNLHPRLWSANSVGIYNWWLQRSNAQISVSYFATNADQAVLSYSISGSTHSNTTVEALVPGPGGYSGLQVFTNGVSASGNAWRVNGQVVKVRTGASITNAEIRYTLGPVAQPDTFNGSGPLLSVPAGGVMTNDYRGASGTNLTAILVAPPTNGSITLSNNGGFTYSQGPAFPGFDSFTYKINDGVLDSPPAMVTLLAGSTPPISFSDNFTRGTDPGPLSPWVLRIGQWTVTGGELRGGTNSSSTYANVFLTNIWSDYSVQARLKFPVGAFGGGLGARLDALSGQHYAAWVYPENSPGGSNVFRLIKFSDWSTWTPLAQVSLASVGATFHTVKLAFQGNRIAAFFDGVQLITLADNAPYSNGGVSLDMWADLVPYVLEVDDVLVAPLVADDSYNIAQNGVLNIPAPGVLTNDTEVYGTSLTAALVSTTIHGALTLNSNGSFTYTPATGFFGTDSFIYQANDGTTNLDTARVTINVINSNPAPIITSIARSNLLTTLKWSSISGRTYRLQYKTNLLDPAWIPVSPDLVATGSVVTATNSVGNASRRFYEVILLP